MSSRLPGEEVTLKPPFNIDQTYDTFEQTAQPMSWSNEESIVVRFHELNLPNELIHDCYLELKSGSMLMVWTFKDKDEVGYALHNNKIN